MKLIVGLGNPGAEYAGTRHNVGFEVIDLLAKRHNITVGKRNFKAVYGEGFLRTEKVILARPMTYMNLSGEAVQAIARFYKIEPADMIIIYDDVALPVGKLRLRYTGSAGGQNGMKDILNRLATEDIPRVRVGVGAAGPGKLVGHVLSKFRKEELPLIEEALQRAADAIEFSLSDGFQNAMNRFNVGDAPQEKAEKPTKPRPRTEAGTDLPGASDPR